MLNRRSVLLAPLAILARETRAAVPAMHIGQSSITIDIQGTDGSVFAARVEAWVKKSAGAVVAYYGRFPVPELYLHVIATDGGQVRGGQTFPGDVPLIRVRVGRDAGDDALLHRDWVMVHEMVHLAFPWMNLRNNWMAEGLAVYVESIARVQAGHLTARQIWTDFMKMMPRGLPAPGDGGFDVTVNWGRTYWGGAIFCLMADIAVRVETGNRKGLQHALRAINAQRDFRREWNFRETLAIGDAATGTRVLSSQYEAMRVEAVSPDLPRLWRELGVRLENAGVVLDDAAPLAATRRAIETAM